MQQRLLRRLCACQGNGCDTCQQSGYRGRIAIAEILPPLTSELSAAVLRHADAAELQKLVEAAGMIPLQQRAQRLVEEGITSQVEIRRVLGLT
jgi:general secretion pathway protein E